MTLKSPGACFRAALVEENPLQIVGTINAYSALLAARSGFKALYLSGSGVATASHGLPDLGLTNLQNVLDDASRITSATDLPLLVDIDTGWGNRLSIARTVKSMIKAEVAAVHIEDQVMDKRCGHRPNKQVVPITEMLDRIKAAVDAKTDPDFLIMARTDAIAVEGLEAGIERACRYIEAGADAVFPDAITELSHYQQFVNAVKKPVLANMTEFGKTPLLELDELKQAGVAMVLYPLSAFRAMSQVAINVYDTIRQEGSQKTVLPLMQTREELYECLDYERYESLQDQ